MGEKDEGAVLLSNQPETLRPDAMQDQQRERPQRSHELSMREVALQIAERLGVAEDEELLHEYIRQIVWDFGRTQAQLLGVEALQNEG